MKANEFVPTHENLVDFFSTALYGCDVFGVANYSAEYAKVPEDKRDGDCYEDNLADILLNGGHIEIVDLETEGGEENAESKLEIVEVEYDGGYKYVAYKITMDDIVRGFSASREAVHLSYVLFDLEEGDYFTAFNLLQYVIFGEVIYG